MLNDWHIVILRPEHQAQNLISALQSVGAKTHLLPLMEIIPIQENGQNPLWHDAISDANMLIVTSANAVFCVPPNLLAKLNPKAFIMTMGEATTKALQEKANNLVVQYTAANGATSESVLTEDFLQQSAVNKQKIVLLAGEGGRTVLADTLNERGALVQWIKVYRQSKPDIDLNSLLVPFAQYKKLCFVATSSRLLENLLSMTHQDHHAWLLCQQIIVISQRIYSQAKTWGFKHITLAQGANAQSIVQACNNLL